MSKKCKVGDAQDVNLNCVCRQRNKNSELMVQCDFCDGWFHPRYVDLDEDEAEHLSTWNCPGCVDVMTENPSLSKKALLAFHGRIGPKTVWGPQFLVTDIDERVLDEKIKQRGTV